MNLLSAIEPENLKCARGEAQPDTCCSCSECELIRSAGLLEGNAKCATNAPCDINARSEPTSASIGSGVSARKETGPFPSSASARLSSRRACPFDSHLTASRLVQVRVPAPVRHDADAAVPLFRGGALHQGRLPVPAHPARGQRRGVPVVRAGLVQARAQVPQEARAQGALPQLHGRLLPQGPP